MEAQGKIARCLAEPENLCRLDEWSKQMSADGPVRYARAVCERLDFRDPLGRTQHASCLVALRKLERQGRLVLPVRSRITGGLRKPRRLPQAVESPRDVPEHAGEIKELALELVKDAKSRALWNEMILREHPFGTRPLVGRILRYVVRSEHGYLGAVGFSSSAVHLAPRDRWIGWDDEVRRKHLDRVVSLSRFLIRPSVRCKNLASKVLSMAVQQVGRDYTARYGVEILLLETFVDRAAHAGTCFRAANWVGVGQSSGRGRQDRRRTASESLKDIYVYPLSRSFRQKLGVEERLKPLELSEGLSGPGWARQEFGGAELGHVGRVERVIQMAEGKGRKPNASWLEVVDGDRQQLKGIYRLIDQPDDSELSMAGILKGHQERTQQRMAGQAVVLCAQDSTDLNYAERLECEGLGWAGKNQTKTVVQGLRLHSTLALTEEGIPLGVLRVECQAREELEEEQKDRDGRNVPIEEKETYRWLQSLEACIEASKGMPRTMLVNIADREGDMYDLFERARNEPRVHLLVRAQHDRRMGETGSLFEQVRDSEERAEFEVKVPRQSARRKQGKREARKKQPARTAKVVLRYRPCQIYPPRNGVNSGKKPVAAWIIYLQEKNPPEGVEPLEWYLLTTLTVDSVATTLKLVKWYCLRWRIEDWHRVLKSGCEVEDHANQTAERLKRALAIDVVVAYRILMLTLLGRELPELPAEVMFSDIELRVLTDWGQKKRRIATPLATVAAAIAVLAAMGGYLGRKSDPPVGTKILRRAYTRLQDLCEGYVLANLHSRPDEKPGHG